MWNTSTRNFIEISRLVYVLEDFKDTSSYGMSEQQKSSGKGQFSSKSFRPFNDLWGQRSFLQSSRLSSELYAQKFS